MNYFDMHCHFVPGVDDGADSFDTAMQLVKKEYEDGVRNIIVTPHYRPGMFETPREIVNERYEMLEIAVKKAYPDINLYKGCEFHSHMTQLETLENDKDFIMAGNKVILLEFSRLHSKSYIRDKIYELQMEGYTIIIAHSERYEPLYSSLEFINELRSMGAYVQINCNSIIGLEGHAIKKFCKKLLKEEMIDFIGSDGHNMKSRIPNIGKCADYLAKKVGKEYRDLLLIENPRSIILGK